MPDKLLIRLKNTSDAKFAMDWLLADESGEFKNSTANNFSDIVKNTSTIVVLVPGEDISLNQISLPRLSPTRMLKAIPFALEDQLAEDASMLHFAYTQAAKGTNVPIAIVSKATMDKWIAYLNEVLKEDFLKVKRMLPDVLAISWQPSSWQIVINGSLVYIKTDKYAGFVIEKSELPVFLKLLYKRKQEPVPQVIKIYGNANDLLSKDELAQYPMPIEFLPLPQKPLTLMQGSNAINLMQGDYAPSQKKITLEQLVWTGIGTIAVWLLLVTLLNVANFFILKHEKNTLDSQIQQIYATVNPGKPIPSNPKDSMQKDLSTLRSTHTGSAFIRLVNIIGPGLRELIRSDVNVKSMTYRANQIAVEMESNDLTKIEELQHSLEAQGLKVVISSAERGTNGLIQTRLTIEEIS